MKVVDPVSMDEIDSKIKHREWSLFFTLTLLILSVYIVFLAIASELSYSVQQHTSYTGVPLKILFGVAALYYSRATGRKLHQLGVNIRGWRRAVGESLVVTIFFLFGLTLLKLWIIQREPEFSGPLFEYQYLYHWHGSNRYILFTTVYACFVFVQQLVVNGVIQGELTRLISFKRAPWWAIFISGTLYVITHVHLSLFFAGVLIIPALVWGWLYYRHQTLVGITLSHLIVGVYLFYILGIDFLR